MSNSGQATIGNWENEQDAAAFFDVQVERSGMAEEIHREVWGNIVQPRIGTTQSRVRIDRILMPSQRLLSAGWPHGPIGVELKKSNMKLGPVIVQTLDYQRAAFEIYPGYHFMLEWSFLWPAETAYHDLASIMTNNRIGTVEPMRYGGPGLVFNVSGTTAIRCSTGFVDAKELKFGRKSGSRSGKKKSSNDGNSAPDDAGSQNPGAN